MTKMTISVVVTVSRPQFVDLVKQNLRELDLGGHVCELVVMVDNNSMEDFMTDDLRERFSEVKVGHTSHTKPPEGNIPNARDRISQVRNESRELVGETDFVFSFEDDTVIPSNALFRLLRDYRELDAPDIIPVGLISGIQVGRQGLKILGAWHVDNTQFPTEVTSLGKNEVTTPLAEVSGTGFYCYLTPTHLYKEATYGWHEPVGPDVWYGLWLRTKGYKVYVDQSVVCGHKVGTERSGFKVLTPDNVEVVTAKFTKTPQGWSHKVKSGV